MGRYVMKGKQYFLSLGRNFAFFVALYHRYQATLLKDAQDLFVDITYTGNGAFPYLLNMVAFNDLTLTSMQSAGYLVASKTAKLMPPQYPKFSATSPSVTLRSNYGANLRQIMVDFDQAQYNELQNALGADLAKT